MSAPKVSIPVFYYLFKTLGCHEARALLMGGDARPEKPAAPVKQQDVGDNDDDDDDFDPFADETPEEQEAQAKLAQQSAEKKAAPKKKVVINKSTLVIDIKPNSIDTDLEAIEKAVRQITMEGLEWATTTKKVPIAFGLNKLQMGCIIVDDLVATDDIIEHIEIIGMTPEEATAYRRQRETGDDEEGGEDDEAPGWVQSAEIVSFQKL